MSARRDSGPCCALRQSVPERQTVFAGIPPEALQGRHPFRSLIPEFEAVGNGFRRRADFEFEAIEFFFHDSAAPVPDTENRVHPSVHRSRRTGVSGGPACNGTPAVSAESPDVSHRKRKKPAFAEAEFPSVECESTSCRPLFLDCFTANTHYCSEKVKTEHRKGALDPISPRLRLDKPPTLFDQALPTRRVRHFQAEVRPAGATRPCRAGRRIKNRVLKDPSRRAD